RAPSRTSATGTSASAPIPSRKHTSVAGSSSRTPILMNMNEAPQSDASASSMTRWRRLTSLQTSAGAVLLPRYTRALDAGRAGTAAPPCAGVDRRGAGPHPRVARPRSERLRAGGLLPPLVGALRLQALGPPLETASLPGRTRLAGPRRERGRDRPRRRRARAVQ